MAMNTFVLETETHDGKKEIHGAGIGGVPDMSAEELGEHLTRLDHFRGKMKKVTIRHRSALVKRDIANIQKTTGKELPPMEVVVHEHANSNHLDPLNPPKEPEPVLTTEPVNQTPPPEEESEVTLETVPVAQEVEETVAEGDPAPEVREVKPPAAK